MKKIVVTGGSGFIGSYLVKKLVKIGHKVTVIDNQVRGDNQRLKSVQADINLIDLDIRDEDALCSALKGIDIVYHLAAVNGTENFYNQPDLVLDVGLRGALSVVNGCMKQNITELVVASSAEVYQDPKIFPTPENIPLTLPNSINPRYSYGGSKIISELIAMNYGREHFEKIQIFRPHNVYGPNMGWKHVVPQFIKRMVSNFQKNSNENFLIEGSGKETRAFAYIDDVVDGILIMQEKGNNREIYNIGNDHEVSIIHLARVLMQILELECDIVFTEALPGGTPRRCPDLIKMRSLGYNPKINLKEGLYKTYEWYSKNMKNNTQNSLL